ncbi:MULTISPECIES: TraB/GumN family protein [unclassified Haladaptatus]|uniref:TraB/GumN family protein n=1 Tax=unclassified Haladaptatus TaxID=2622732 RepID=UPI0023E7FE64|nr:MULTISPECIES: TraB/GumN family protein [unclassified Haladaptatus]
MSETAESAPTEGSVRVVGTAHVSADSVDEVREVIDEERPDVVAVELDEGRYRQLKGETPDDLDASDLLHGNTVFQFLAYWLLSYIQTRMGERFDIKPGADMMAAVETAESLGINVALVDRDIQVTIQRFWARMTFFEKLKMLWQLTIGLAGFGEEADDIDMNDLTNADVVSAMMAEFRRFSPGGAEALIDERDAFIAHRLVALRQQGFDVVAIVGAGHREGILGYLENPGTLPPMESLVGTQKKRFSVYKLFGYLFTLGFLVFFLLLAMAGVRNDFLLELFVAFFLVNGIFSFALAKIAGAHWSSATVGGAVAWMTSINPLLAPGWFAGYVELRYTSVNISDIGKLNEILADEESPLGDLWDRMRAVPLFRLILIVAMTNIGSMIASGLFAFVILPYMAADVGGIDGVVQLMVQGAQNSADLIVRQFT